MRPLILLSLALSLSAQTPTGTVTVATTITATAGPITCTGTPAVVNGASSLHMVCTVAGKQVNVSDSVVPDAAIGAVVYSVHVDSNAVTWILRKNANAPDSWEVAANGVLKRGDF